MPDFTPSHRAALLNQQRMVAELTSAVHEPTSPLSPSEQEHFTRIIHSREHETWSPHDLNIATQLAKSMRRYDDLAQACDEQGSVVRNNVGNLVLNPTFSAMSRMNLIVFNLTRVLGLSASQRGVSGEKEAQRSRAEREARAALEAASGVNSSAGELLA